MSVAMRKPPATGIATLVVKKKKPVFPNNKNIESLYELFAEAREYVTLRFEACRIDLVSKLAALLSALALGGILLTFLAIILLFLSYTAALALASWLDNGPAAFALVALGYLLLGGMIYAFRRVLIMRPLMRLLAGLFLDKPEEDERPRKEDTP